MVISANEMIGARRSQAEPRVSHGPGRFSAPKHGRFLPKYLRPDLCHGKQRKQAHRESGGNKEVLLGLQTRLHDRQFCKETGKRRQSRQRKRGDQEQDRQEPGLDE